MKKNLIYIFAVLAVILGWFLISLTLGSDKSKNLNVVDDKKINSKSTSVSLVCSSQYKILATYYDPSDRGVMQKLKITVMKDNTEENYEMIQSVSASGARFETPDKTFSLWEHQGEFNFAKNDKTIATCALSIDATYYIDGTPTTLVFGKSEKNIPNSSAKIVTQYFGDEVMGDFNNDGLEDRAFIITQSGGGSGTFFYLVSALNSENGYVGSNAILLGDRIAPQTVNLDDKDQNVIVVNYAERKPDEPMTVSPSMGVSRKFKIENSKLLEINK